MGERIKDLIYDFSDIIISLVIITMIFGVVSWKISDSMAYTQFTGQPTNAVLDKTDKDSKDSTGDQASANTNENPADTQGSETSNTDTSAGTNATTNTTTPPTNTTGSTTDTAAQGGKPSASAGTTTGTAAPSTSGVSADVKIVIPPGSAGITIAKILKEQGIIADTKAFISRVDALKMGPKLKAGTFTIKAGSTVDDVINTIAGKK